MVSWCNLILSAIFEYDTQKIVHIQSKTVGTINRIIQLIIISYIVGFVIVYKKGYQEFDDVVGSVSTKVKGYSFANRTIAGDFPGIWDVADYTVPPQENSASFVTTNAILTYDQAQTKCPEAISADDDCKTDKDCPPMTMKVGGNGVRTGKCVNSSQPAVMVCEIYSWCPLEDDRLVSRPLLTSAENFTLFLKNNILFPKFGVSRSNILGSDLKRCRFNPTDPILKFCPIFLLAQIVNFTNHKFEELNKLGASIQIQITWNCNLDFEESTCLPKYSFKRLDNNVRTNTSEGYNFRYAHYYKIENVTKRTLVKAYGIQFIIVVQGRAGKFNVVPLMLNIGSGLALLSLASIMCDIIMLYVLKSRNFYKEKKYQNVEEFSQDAFPSNLHDFSSSLNLA